MQKQKLEKKFTPPTKPFVNILDNTQTDNMVVDSFLSENKEKIEKLVASGQNINTKNQFGHTALHVACLKDDFERVKILLECGANVNVQDGRGNPVIMLAIKKGNLQFVEEILKYNPDLKIKNNEGKTPVHLAIEIYNECIHSGYNKKEISKILSLLKQ